MMNTMKVLPRSLLFVALMVLGNLALAHTGLKESSPADGATLNEAPASIDLVFTADVRLIKLEVTSNGKVLDTGFKPGAESMASYSIPTSGLADGRYTVNWAVIGADGHTVTNSFSFSVDSSAIAASAP